MNSMSARGHYSKGSKKREEILNAALAIFAEEGYQGTSLRSVAAECGLTLSGTMHYFASRDDLLTQVILKRDEVSSTEESLDPDAQIADFINFLHANAAKPGLVELFVTLTAAARNPEHPAHQVLNQRYEELGGIIASQIAQYQARGGVRADLDPERTARLVLAVADGAQLQWLVNPERSLSEPLETLWYDILQAQPRPE